MTRIDLVTGFLGSGKTTFLKQYIRYLLSKNERICVLEFDYGAVNVDMMLLQEFNNAIDIEMVAGGCDYSCHLRRFKTKLIAMGMKHYDRVIIEPSGIFDPDELFDTLYEEPLDSFYQMGACISIADPGISHELSKEEEYILTSQIGASSIVLLSKVQNYSSEEVNAFISYLGDLMHKYKMQLDTNRIIAIPYSELDDNIYSRIARAGYLTQDHEKMNVMQVNNFQSVYFLDLNLTLEEIKQRASILFSSKEYGTILRIKGFIFEKNNWVEFNLTRNDTRLSNLTNGQSVVIVIGENLNESAIKDLFNKN